MMFIKIYMFIILYINNYYAIYKTTPTTSKYFIIKYLLCKLIESQLKKYLIETIIIDKSLTLTMHNNTNLIYTYHTE